MGIFVPTDDQAQMENLTSNGHFELACAISRWTAFWLVSFILELQISFSRHLMVFVL